MDRFATDLDVLRKDGKVSGFKITAAGNTDDENFCLLLPKRLNNGKANIEVSDGKMCIKSNDSEEEWSFDLSDDDEPQLEKILSGLGKTYHARCNSKKRGFGTSFEASFKEGATLNKKEQNKRKRSFSMSNGNPTRPKSIDHREIKKWERIFV